MTDKIKLALLALDALVEDATINNDEEYKSRDQYPSIMIKWQNGQDWIDTQESAIRQILESINKNDQR